ncbi:glycosyltransferase family 2 protein [Limnohabitans sp.]|uniref:glycosyltransferase family 2 protein n=1 Tax=Limnohabitans sp. TaxID=1907725 RepID=UPI002AFEA17B|nr:glycosyltransferase family 2 protein [Limnohabitans sp.]
MTDSEISSVPIFSQTVDVLIRSTGRPELHKALASLAEQTHKKLNVYIADAAAIGLTISESLPFPVQIVTTGEKMQRSQAANALLKSARSSLAIFLDEDDWLLPGHISKLLSSLAQEPQAVLAYSDTRCIRYDDKGNEVTVREYVHPYHPEQLMLENYIPIHAALFQLTPETRACHFDTELDLFEDWDFWLQLQQVGPFVHAPGFTAIYLIHGDSGAGVTFDRPEIALKTLQQMLAKWQIRWESEQLQKLWGYARQIPGLQSSIAQLIQTHAIELAQLKSLHQTQIQALETLRQSQIHEFQTSRSWRITAPLRAIAEFRRTLSDILFMEMPRKFSARTLSALTALYKNNHLNRLFQWVPSSVKRQIRNRLMYLAREPRHISAPGVQPANLSSRKDQPVKVSIIIPVYNHVAYLRECIDSALNQTYSSVEVVIVDDHSPDPLVKPLLQSYASHPRVRLLFNDSNQGISESQNRAIIAANGDLIAFLDCDDVLDRQAVDTCVQYWQSDTVYLHTGRINIDQAGVELSRIHFADLPRQDYFAENLRAMYATHLKIIRRDVFAKVGLFDTRFDSAQDYEMLMRIAFHYASGSFVHVPEFLYSHRLHAQQTTETQNSKQLQLTAQIQAEARLRQNIRNGDYSRFVSIIMLSYGKHTQTLEALQGLKKTVHIPHEIVLYDNGSDQETVNFIKANIDGQLPFVRVIYGDINLGPAQGRRKALEHAKGEWFIVFDNDEVPEPGWIEELLVRAESHPQAGAVCCRVTFPNGKLQFSGGKVEQIDPQDPVIDLGLHDIGKPYTDLSTCRFREVDWCPIGATLFTVNIAPYLHDGYPNTFEDAGVSFALKKAGYQLLNAPGALVWHEHITFHSKVDMGEKYMADRYNPKMMLKSIATFYAENNLIIKDEYIWRENDLNKMTRAQLLEALHQASLVKTSFA